jgi:hypothetical protein
VLPPFDESGVLPQDSEATLDELRQSHLVTGRGVGSEHWDSSWRAELVVRVGVVFDLFSRAGGLVEFWIDGSFVEAVDHPQDIDAFFTLDDPREWLTLPDRLNQLEGSDIWTWRESDRRMFPGSVIPKPPFWGKYRVDIYPELSRPSGIFDEHGNPLTFSGAFRQQRQTYRRKGIVRLRSKNDQI